MTGQVPVIGVAGVGVGIHPFEGDVKSVVWSVFFFFFW